MVMVVGGLSAVQVGCNGLLGRGLGNPVAAAAVNFSIGWLSLVSLLSVALWQGWLALPTWGHALASLPWYAWLGGLLGSFFVLAAVIAGPVIGAGTFTAALVSAQLLASVVMDHYGWLGFAQQRFSWQRGLGIVCLLLGLWLMKRR
jgi:bacterial/archaeal transporter family-2 protein